jgi:hypothetical protein
MRTWSISVGLWLTVFGAAHSVVAAMLYTAPLRNPAGDGLECRAVNVGRSTVQITSEGVNPDGTVFSKHSANVAPGTQAPIAAGTCGATNGQSCVAYCRFTAPSKKDVRGSAVAISGTTHEATAALPAQ